MTPEEYINTPLSERFNSHTMDAFIEVLNKSYLSVSVVEEDYIHQAVRFYVATINKKIARFSSKNQITHQDFMNYFIQSHVDNNAIPQLSTSGAKRQIVIYANRARDLKSMQSIYQLLPHTMYRERLKHSKRQFKAIQKEIKERCKRTTRGTITANKDAPYKFRIT